MESFRFDSRHYLQKLCLSGEIRPNLQGLKTLQRAQLFNIPFENFDIQLGRGIDLDPAPLYEKLVRRPRGGYCFELNGLLLMALRDFGFEVRPLLARVHLTGVPSGRGHQVSLVELDGRKWIADAGFGKDTPPGPLALQIGEVQELGGQSFRLADGGRFGTMLQKLEENQWRNLYSFDMEYVFEADIAYGNHYTSTSPNSFFTTSRLAAKPFEDGWAVLFNYRLTLIRNGREQVIDLPDGPGYLDALKTHFGIELDAPYEALKPV
jgi:N-hydroxyarylamine O-acetyltransferase